jgi:hypothetical protein
VIPLHMGALHPFEQALTLLLAFGPFVVLGFVVWRRRGEDEREDQASRDREDEIVPQGD